MNWLVVSGAASVNYLTHDVPHRQVSQVWYASPMLGTAQLSMIVYTPPGYDQGSRRSPVLYLYHGAGEDEEA